MKARIFYTFALSLALTATAYAQQTTTLRVFSGGQNQRPDLMRKLFDEYQKANPGIKIDIETGGATSELQRQYLTTVLSAKDTAIDIYMIDIVNPAQYYSAGWLEPLDNYIGASGSNAMKQYLPVYAQSNIVNGKVAALPAFADAMFMYYRRDLLAKYNIREPRTWDELAIAAKKITEGEKNPNLQGLSIQGAPVEGAVCTFLLPYWSQGKAFNDAAGRMTLDKEAAVKGMNMWLNLVDQGVIKKNVAEVKTPDTANEFKAGQVAFAISWGFAWDRFQGDADTQVKDKVGVMALPAMPGGRSATCVGGFQWAVSAFSKSKTEAAKLVQFMATPATSKFLAIEGSLLPTYPAIYTDPEVTKQVPWFLGAGMVVPFGRSRPMTTRYPEVSDTIRTNASAILARTKTAEEGVNDIENKLKNVMR